MQWHKFIISIHLMLLFICFNEACSYIRLNFNTSHVTVYLLSLCLCSFFLCISIHLMLLFIGETGEHENRLWGFQYISCYCLSYHVRCMPASWKAISIHLMLLFIRLIPIGKDGLMHFNTSHVTVYPVKLARAIKAKIFQYISYFL